MNTANLKPKTPGQWFKLALVPALSVILLVVLWQQYLPESTTDIEPETTPQSQTVANAIHTSSGLQAEAVQTTWPKARLDEVVAFNPFEPQPELETEEGREAAPSSGASVTARSGGKHDPRLAAVGQLQAIFVDAQGAAAILDSQVVRVGDTLPSGGRVVEITPDGIKLEGL